MPTLPPTRTATQRFVVEIPLADAELIRLLLEHVPDDPKACSHGLLTIEQLAAMLLEDVALSVRRPGSWEGANMAQVLSSHGYEP